jgi:fatty acid desaturase
VPDNDDPFRNARTTKAGFLVRIFLAPYWVNYHVEHHLLMYVPCWQLPATQKALQARGFSARMETAPGYLSVLRKACARRDDEDKPGDLVHNARRRVAGNFTEGFTSNAS